MILFDRKFGPQFLDGVPQCPGVYRFCDAENTLYVGKAKNLRRRLAQYRRARGGKMRKIVKAASAIRWDICSTELEACLLELREIQSHRPRLNISGRFSYRYPLIGMEVRSGDFYLLFSTTPELFPSYRFFGTYRSRSVTSEAFFSLVALLGFLGHPIRMKRKDRKPYSYEFGLRRLPVEVSGPLPDFLRGHSSEFLETLVLALLEKPGARAKRSEIQEQVEALELFWNQECVPLAKAIEIVQWDTYPVPQSERDPLFVRAGFLERQEPE